MAASDNSNEKLLSLLTYPIPLVGIIILLVESMKSNPVLRGHAIQSIALGVVLFIVSFVIGLIPVVQVVACILPLVFLGITVYYGIQAYNGKDVTIPVVTDFCKKQGWI